jgi:hypothetical protein
MMANETAAPADATPTIPTDPAAIAARDQELTKLAEQDPGAYYYSEDGKFAREHLAIRQAGQPKEVTSIEPDGAEDAGETDDLADIDDIDLDAPADGPEEDADDGRPDLSAYEALPEGMELTESGEALIGIVNEHCAEHGIDPDGRNGLFDLHTRLIEAQTARLAEMDKAANKETAAALTERLGSKEASDAYIATAREAARLMPKPLRDALKTARLPDGRKVAHMPELADFLHQVASRQGQAATTQPTGRAAMQQELRDLDQLMVTNITEYRRPWRGTGLSGSDRHLEIMRELGSEAPAKPSAADLRAEERELAKLRDTDPQLYQFGNWRGTGRPAADRLYALQMGRG